MTEELKKYELMVILSGDIVESDLEKEVETLRKLLAESTKGISYEDNWGRRDLTYSIKKQRRGYYLVFDFTAAPSSIAELRTNIKLNQAVLRHLIISLPENYEPGRYKKAPAIEEEIKVEGRRKAIKVGKDIEEIETAVEKLKEKKEEKREEQSAPEEKPKLEAKVAGKEEEEELKTVEKRLEKILENPDLDIK